MAIVILGLALLFAVAVIVVLFILLREAYREISSYYVPVRKSIITSATDGKIVKMIARKRLSARIF